MSTFVDIKAVMLALAACGAWLCGARQASAAPPAFPGAVGQGAAATGGRGDDVYHVTTLQDYNPKTEAKVPGSLRHAIRSAEGPRTIVFDVSGPIALHAELEISKDNLTVAGQTSPAGVTLWGYPVEASKASNVIIRYLRFRTGDFHARRERGRESFATGDSPALTRPPVAKDSRPLSQVAGNNDMDPGSANGVYVGGGSERVIMDHVSVSWGIDETLSVTKARDVTIQHSIIAESLNESLHPKGPHGYGSLIRGELTATDQQAGVGGYTLFRNLWAHHVGRNPSVGGQQSLEPGQSESQRRRTDLNLVNNVVYNWGGQATHRSEYGQVRINLIGNAYICGPAKKAKYFFRENTPATSLVYQQGNWRDLDQDERHDGELVASDAQAAAAFQGFSGDDQLISRGEPFGFYNDVARHSMPAEDAYAETMDSVGASLWRDAVDRRVIDSVTKRTGGLINSQEEFRGADGKLPGIDDLPATRRPEEFDADRDGMADDFERTHGLDPTDAADRNGTTLSKDGYTNLEVYLNGLAGGSRRF